MDEPDLSSLTYKELQALAVRCRVPGNMKKHQLVRVLDAVQKGNMLEVDRIIAELQQTRKKRLRKTKHDKMNVVSTPLHSPDYGVPEDYYYSQQHPPYQWVGAEEEICSREEEASRFPDYYEFQQFLSRRIKYRSLVSSDNELAQMPSVVDLRMSTGTGIVQSADANCDQSNVIRNSYSYDQSLPNKIEAEEDTNGNNQIPVLLKKMLQAPVGANLGKIASPKTSVSQILSSDRKLNISSEQMDDSDTLTADSDGENDDFWDNDKAGNNRDFCSINNGKDQLNINQAQFEDKNVQGPSQLSGNFLFNGNNLYQNIGNASDVQANCQKWIVNNSFTNYGGNSVDISRSYNPGYYVNASGNAKVNVGRNMEENYSNNENMNYETSQWNSGNEAYPYYQINNEAAQSSVIPNDASYVQHMSKRICDVTEKYFAQGSSNNWHANVSCNNSHNIAQSSQFGENSYSKEMEAALQSSENNVVQYNMGYYQQYPVENNQSQIGYSNGDQSQYQYQQQQQFQLPEHQHAPQHDQYQQQTQQQYQQPANVAVQEINDHKNFKQLMESQAIADGALDAFWPHRPINTTITSCGPLEPILNLNNKKIADSEKLDETSCVYCYIEPIVTHRIEFTNLLCTQAKQLKTKFRQHSFRPTPLVYNDASTGMRMANAIEISSVEACPQETLNYVPSTSSMDFDSENMASVESSDDSINDVWIHDYNRCPSSTEYAPQGDCLVIDENENDLFSL